MAVTSTTTLPDQPSAGSSRLVALGGDGWISPKSYYELQVNLAMDASGGNADVTIDMDPRFETFIKRVEIAVLAAAADETFQITQRIVGSGFSSSISGLTFRNGVSSFTPGGAWWDPPVLLPIDRLEVTVANTDGDTLIVTTWIANYNINASHKIPISVIASGLGRTSQMSND